MTKYSGFLFFLAGILLLLPVASYYAVSWGDIKEKVIETVSVIDKDTVKKYMPGVAVALGIAGGMYYYLMSIKDGKENVTPITVSKYNLIPRGNLPPIVQYNVYSQTNYDGGGAASCGYHALLRGMQLVVFKEANEGEEKLQQDLNDSSLIAVYFGKNGEWRKQIIIRRKIENIKATWLAKINLIFKKNNLEFDISKSNIEQYKSALGFLREKIIGALDDFSSTGKWYQLSIQDIKRYITMGLEILKNNSEQQVLLTELQNSEIIDQYFDFKKMQEVFFIENNLMDLQKFQQGISQSADNKNIFNGDWLDQDDIQYLWEHNIKYNVVRMRYIECDLSIVDDITLIGKEHVDLITLFVKNKIKPLLNEKHNFFVIFILGTMENEKKNVLARPWGHWYPLVMHQDREGKRNYYIMDSLNNKNRLHDPNAWKIIDLIES